MFEESHTSNTLQNSQRSHNLISKQIFGGVALHMKAGQPTRLTDKREFRLYEAAVALCVVEVRQMMIVRNPDAQNSHSGCDPSGQDKPQTKAQASSLYQASGSDWKETNREQTGFNEKEEWTTGMTDEASKPLYMYLSASSSLLEANPDKQTKWSVRMWPCLGRGRPAEFEGLGRRFMAIREHTDRDTATGAHNRRVAPATFRCYRRKARLSGVDGRRRPGTGACVQSGSKVPLTGPHRT
ncbi:hypothetical protein Bbelb_219960 [Branchiostoma belcheri]|nr:hypothetical protein Bbelb_219960 [Branchiostoma belcheri]